MRFHQNVYRISFTPKTRPGFQNVEIGNVTLTKPNWRTVSHHKAKISRGQNLKSLALAVLEKFQGCKILK